MRSDTKGRINEYLETVFTSDEAMLLLQEGVDISEIIIERDYETDLYESAVDEIFMDDRKLRRETKGLSQEQAHAQRCQTWMFPPSYRLLDVKSTLCSRCTTQEEITRVESEYAMYVDRDLVIMLQFMMWLVDHMRAHNVLWGVGRGSSVASFCLFLIGISRVNPMRYGLGIDEFLK